MHSAYISVGSNLGDKLENCQRGVASLTRHGCEVTAQSGIYRTEPVDYLDQDWFINYVVQIETQLQPLQLLAALKRFSANPAAGRMKSVSDRAFWTLTLFYTIPLHSIRRS